MSRLLRELRAAIPCAFDADEYRSRRQALEDKLKQRKESAIEDFERRASEQGVVLIRTPAGFGLGPIRDGRPIPQEEFQRLPEQERRDIVATVEHFDAELRSRLRGSLPVWEREHRERIRALDQDTVRTAIEHLTTRSAPSIGSCRMSVPISSGWSTISRHARLRDLTDLLREADHWASQEGEGPIKGAHVARAVDARIRRSSRLKDRIDEEISHGTLPIAITGDAVGQAKALAVASLGDLAVA
jgi:hypothetical protein